MVLRGLAARDKVTLVKANGTVAGENIQAQVSAGKIITYNADLPIEPGDHFQRSLSSGLVEDYVVDDPNFMRGIPGCPPLRVQGASEPGSRRPTATGYPGNNEPLPRG